MPPGVYSVCDQDNGVTNEEDEDTTATCWFVQPDGSAKAVFWLGTFDETVPAVSIDVTGGDYDAIRFTGKPSS